MIFSLMWNKGFQKISDAMMQKGEVSPFLFLSENLELLHAHLLSYLEDARRKYGVDAQSIFHLADTGESLKIAEVKQFLSYGAVRPRFAFQVFLIENISRMTPQAQNACLKFFEEPWRGNIVILTNTSESWILETILSRVQIIHSQEIKWDKNLEFYISMMHSHHEHTSDELIRYFFSGKYEKQEYIHFLYALIEYITKTGKYTQLLDEIHEDIGGIFKNNLQGKYIVDKYIMLLWATELV